MNKTRQYPSVANIERQLREAAITAADPSIVDHYSELLSTVRDLKESLPLRYYRELPAKDGRPRVYWLAREVLTRLPGLPIEQIATFLIAYQKSIYLWLGEIWAFGMMLKLAVLEDIAAKAGKEPVDGLIKALRALEETSWREFLEEVSPIERILRGDPWRVYAQMDFDTRDQYRHAVERIARRGRMNELEVAELAIELSRKENRHVGFYLLGDGVANLEKRAHYRNTVRGLLRKAIYRWPNFFYMGVGGAVALVLVALVYRVFPHVPVWLLPLLLIPASQVSTAIVNPFVNLMIPPRRLPRLDFSDGIPEEHRTFVVIPTLLLSRPIVEKLLERLEIHYLANRDPNLFFALLTDFPDAPQQRSEQDTILDICSDGIRRLNKRYSTGGVKPFYLFHRDRQWSECQSCWMGRERKRGKLNDFNRLLLGDSNGFSTIQGDTSVLQSIRYVITLDSDTQFPLESAHKLIGNMAHPLNRPVIDRKTNTVRQGYGLLQPRVSISMESSTRSRLARIYSGQVGFDPYTTAVSDVYQDLHGQASYTGKGIYDVRAFEAVAGGRFPDNALLSHDLIEGEYSRVGLVTDVEVIDDYPATYEAYSKRKHRWVRGDWQIFSWLLRSVPVAGGKRERNPLSTLSRWKIADNLRRSLLEMSLALLIILSFFVLPGGPLIWTLAAFAVLAAPAYVELLWRIARVPKLRFWVTYWRESLFRFAQIHLDALLTIIFLLHQALLMGDAIVRTMVRLFYSKRNLLEWESMAAVEAGGERRASLVDKYLFAAPVIAVVVFLFVPATRMDGAVTVVACWILSPFVAMWLNTAPFHRQSAEQDNQAFLRDAALQTWRFFAELPSDEENWLIPDFVVEDGEVAARTSPTNIGLQLAATLSGHDFGFLTRRETTAQIDRLLCTLARMEKHRGHFFNWYDNASLRALPPRYISTVDSGNLAAALIAVKQGCLEILDQPVIGLTTLEGLRAHVIRLRDASPAECRHAQATLLIGSLLRALDTAPSNLFHWEGLLTEMESSWQRLDEHISCDDPDVGYWYRALGARIHAALEELCSAAPWLGAPFELDMRGWIGYGPAAALMAQLNEVPKLANVPAQHDAIQQEMKRLIDTPGMPAGLSRMLENLLLVMPASREHVSREILKIREHAAVLSGMVEDMKFGFLFDEKRKLFHIGYDTGAGALDHAYYDLLASEARTAVFVAIAKGEVPRETWFHLGRKMITYRGHRTLLSWSGTMFEYLMPAIFLRMWSGTLLDECAKAMLRIQRVYGRESRIPWGISESACARRGSSQDFQYQAFGVPVLAAKRQMPRDLVTAPYASALALMVDRPAAARNLRDMVRHGWTGRYGFYEAIDWSNGRSEVVPQWMAHHQGMALLSIGEAILDQPMQRRFHSDAMVQATDYLLQERAPLLVDVVMDEPLPPPATVEGGAGVLPQHVEESSGG